MEAEIRTDLKRRIKRRPNAKIEEIQNMGIIHVYSYGKLVVKITYDRAFFAKDHKWKTITLVGQYRTNTTKKLINEAAKVYDLPYWVYQRDDKWYCDFKDAYLGYKRENNDLTEMTRTLCFDDYENKTLYLENKHLVQTYCSACGADINALISSASPLCRKCWMDLHNEDPVPVYRGNYNSYERAKNYYNK